MNRRCKRGGTPRAYTREFQVQYAHAMAEFIYQPRNDINRLAEHFHQKYGSVEKAQEHFDHNMEFDLVSFEKFLRKRGVKCDDVVRFFEYIDADWSGKISCDELFWVLKLKIEDIQRREQEREAADIARVYENLAKTILDKYGSVEAAFATGPGTVTRPEQRKPTKEEADMNVPMRRSAAGHTPLIMSSPDGAHSEREGEKGLSLARFRKLVQDMGMDVDARTLQMVFSKIDDNNTGVVSLDELESALSNHLVANIVVEMGDALIEKWGSISMAFENTGMGAAGLATFAGNDPPLSEEQFVRLIRGMEVLVSEGIGTGKVAEQNARFLYKTCKGISRSGFESLVNTEHQRASQVRARKQAEIEQREDQRKKWLRRQLCIDSGEAAQKSIGSWVSRVDDPVRPAAAEDVTRGWATKAREGKSRTQLHAYIETLNAEVERRQAAVSTLQGTVDDRCRDAFTPAYGACEVTPISLGERTPATPALMGTQQLESRAVKAERLAQAAAVGDENEVLRCLRKRADVNATAWGGITPVMAAAHHGRAAVLQRLLAEGADLSRTDMRGRTAVDHAYRRPDVCKWLRGRGGRSGRELATEAQNLARQVLKLEADRARLQETLDQMPSVAALRRQASFPAPGEGTPWSQSPGGARKTVSLQLPFPSRQYSE